MIMLEVARARLAAVWFLGSAFIFVLLVAQSLGGIFGSQPDEAWAWAIPNIAPTLSLMISVFAVYALAPKVEEDKYRVRRTFFTLACGLSVFYILNMIVVIAAAPFSATTANGSPVGVMHTSNFWLGPLQGLTDAALTALFIMKTEK